MAKQNPRQVSLGETSKVERPKQLGINRHLEGNPYDLSKTKPEIGDAVDQATRTSNLAINVFSASDPYQPPMDDY
jgi:hypothetical protein